MGRCILSKKEVMSLLFQTESVDKLVILLKVLVVTEEEHYLVNVVLVGNGRT